MGVPRGSPSDTSTSFGDLNEITKNFCAGVSDGVSPKKTTELQYLQMELRCISEAQIHTCVTLKKPEQVRRDLQLGKGQTRCSPPLRLFNAPNNGVSIGQKGISRAGYTSDWPTWVGPHPHSKHTPPQVHPLEARSQ